LSKGKFDFKQFEIKTSASPFSERLHLLVREDYALKRKPPYYVQVILDTADNALITAGTKAIICGYATHEEVITANKKDFGSKLSEKGGYNCYYLPVSKLSSIDKLKT
jgi:hypothetical protein